MAGAEDVWSGVTEGGISAADVRDGTVGGSGAGAFEEGFVVGLDLGTSNSCMALWHLDKMRVKVSEKKGRAGWEGSGVMVRSEAHCPSAHPPTHSPIRPPAHPPTT